MSMFGQQNYLTLEDEPCDFLKIFWTFSPFEPHFLINIFLIRKNVYHVFSFDLNVVFFIQTLGYD